MQQLLIGGDSLNFLTTVPGFLPTDGWSLTYRLRPRIASNAVITLVAVADGVGWRTTAAAGTTAAWSPDVYTWASWVDKSGETYTVGGGSITVKPNPRTTAAGYEDRSREEIDLAAVRAAISARINGDAVIEYTIGTRSLKKEPMAGLIELQKRLEVIVARQRRNAALANGQGRPDRIGVRFA